MTIRARRPEDLPACAAVLTEVHHHDGYPEVWQSDPEGFLDPAGIIAAWVDEVPGSGIVGHVCLTGPTGPGVGTGPDGSANVESTVMLSRLFVDPGAQGRGTARQLIAAALGWAQQRDLAVTLVVDAQTPAVAVYERLGWRFLGSGPAGWVGVDGREPQVRHYAAPITPPTADRLSG